MSSQSRVLANLDASGPIGVDGAAGNVPDAHPTAKADAPKVAAQYKRGAALYAAHRERAALQFIELRIDEHGPAIIRGHAGAYVVFIGWEGSGKSSILLQIGLGAMRAGFAFIYFTTELDDAEASNRLVGIELGESWEDVSRARVDTEQVRRVLETNHAFVVLAEERATIENLELTIDAIRAEQPDREIVLGFDYLQDLDGGEGKDERAKVKSNSRMIRRLAKRKRVLTIAASQTSRDGRESLRNGALGADTATKGAESSQIERDAYLVLALGNPQEQADGTIAMDLNVGKSRMGRGNRLYPIIYDGRTGRATTAGEARLASDVRKERETERGKKKRDTLKRAILDLVSKAPRPMSKADISNRTEGSNTAIADAIKEMIREGTLAHDHRAVKGGHPPIWTPENIATDAAAERPGA